MPAPRARLPRLPLLPLAALFLTLGCQPGGKSTPAAQDGLTLDVTGSTVKVSSGGEIRAAGINESGELKLDTNGLPPGAKVTVGEVEAQPGAKPNELRVSVRKQLGQANAQGTTVALGTLTVALPDGRSANATLRSEPVTPQVLGSLFARAIGQGLTFDGEPIDERRDTAVLLGEAPKFLGRPGAKLADVDLVVEVRAGEKKGRETCESSKADAPGKKVIWFVNLRETLVVAHDRRTGKEASREVLPAARGCPLIAGLAAGASIDGVLNLPAAEAWAKSLVQ